MSDDPDIQAETAEFFAKAMGSGMSWVDALEERCIEILKVTCMAAVLAERERCAKIAENPGFVEATDTDWDYGFNYAKRFIAAAIRDTPSGGVNTVERGTPQKGNIDKSNG